MNMSINQKFTTSKLLLFALPSIVMMVFMSLYTIVDGIFISRYAGSNALSSLNIVFPVINIVIAIAMMFATGGNALISKYLGQGEEKRARECLTQFVVIGTVLSIVLLILTLLFLEPICRVLGSSDVLLADCKIYLKIAMIFAPACTLQTLFQSYFVTAGHPRLGLALTVGAGIGNAFLDYLFIAVFDMGIGGAALATGIGQSIPTAAGVLFFIYSKKPLHFTGFRVRSREIVQACYNGSSEMISQLSNAIVTFLFNMILIRLAGEHGVAAITILLYGQFLFNAIYIGFSIGIAPVVGFQYGAGNRRQLGKTYRSATAFVALSAIGITALSILASEPIVSVFTKDAQTYEIAAAGFRIFAFNFLFSGINIYSSGLFTALSNGLVSAVLSFSRTLVFLVASLLILPQIFGLTGVWLAVPVAEAVTLLLSLAMHRIYFWKPGKKNYMTE